MARAGPAPDPRQPVLLPLRAGDAGRTPVRKRTVSTPVRPRRPQQRFRTELCRKHCTGHGARDVRRVEGRATSAVFGVVRISLPLRPVPAATRRGLCQVLLRLQLHLLAAVPAGIKTWLLLTEAGRQGRILRRAKRPHVEPVRVDEHCIANGDAWQMEWLEGRRLSNPAHDLRLRNTDRPALPTQAATVDAHLRRRPVLAVVIRREGFRAAVRDARGRASRPFYCRVSEIESFQGPLRRGE
jgi:hypothetical protein